MNEENYKKINEQIYQNIEKFGWHVTGVFAGKDTPPFCYSIGIQNSDMPEIIIFGMNIKNAGQIINYIGNLMMDGKKFKVGESYDGIIKVPVKFLNVTQENIEEHMFGATDYHNGSSFDALQMVWADEKGNFPWDDDFEEKFKGYQKLMNEKV